MRTLCTLPLDLPLSLSLTPRTLRLFGAICRDPSSLLRQTERGSDQPKRKRYHGYILRRRMDCYSTLGGENRAPVS